MVGLPEEWTFGDLVARRMAGRDFDDLMAFHQDALVMAHLGGVRDERTTRTYLRGNIDHWVEHGFGMFVVRDGGGTFVGRVGLRFASPLGRREVEVAYAFQSQVWGRGYAVVATEALCSLARQAELCSEVVAFTETTNRQSWRVMEKAGFTFDCHFEYEDVPHVLYRRLLDTVVGG